MADVVIRHPAIVGVLIVISPVACGLLMLTAMAFGG